MHTCALSQLHNGESIHAGANNIKAWMWEGRKCKTENLHLGKKSDPVFNFYFLLRNLMTKPVFCNLELVWMS